VVVHFTSWASMIKAEEDDLFHYIDEKLRNEREKQLNLISSEVKKSTQRELAYKLAKIFDKAEHNMWKQIANIYYQEKSLAEEKLNSTLQDFGCNSEESEKRLKNQETKTFESLQMVVKEKVTNIDLLMTQKFNSHFEVDQEGIPRRWQPNSDIKGMWTKAKCEAEKLIDLFSIIRLTEEEFPLKFFKSTSTGVEVVEELPQVPEQQIIIQPKEAERHLQRFREQSTTSYLSAVKEMERIASQGSIPRYMLVLLLLLGWNEIVWVIQTIIFSPIMLIFFILLLCCAFVVWRLNMTPFIKHGVSMIISGWKQYPIFEFPTVATQKATRMKTDFPVKNPIERPNAKRSYTTPTRSAYPDEGPKEKEH